MRLLSIRSSLVAALPLDEADDRRPLPWVLLLGELAPLSILKITIGA